MRLRLAGCGAFPGPKRPRVLWVGVRGDVDALEELARRLRRACEPFAPAMARDVFRPHLTVARPNGARPRPPLELDAREPVFGDWTADVVTLAVSDLSAKGARYAAFEEFSLAGPTKS